MNWIREIHTCYTAQSGKWTEIYQLIKSESLRLLSQFYLLNSKLLITKWEFIAWKINNDNPIFSYYIFLLLFAYYRDNRARVAIIQNLAWTAGLCILPFIYWMVGDWFTFFALTSLPLMVFLFIPTYALKFWNAFFYFLSFSCSFGTIK